MNINHKKDNLNEITLETFKLAVSDCILDGLSSFAPLGASGNSIILFSMYDGLLSSPSRDRQLSIRLHNDTVEMFITDYKGSFIFYGKFQKRLGVDFISSEFFRLFKILKTHLKYKPQEPI